MRRARQQELEASRLQLQQHSRHLRTRLGEEAVALERPLAVADAVRSRLGWMDAHKQWIAAAAVLPLLLPLILRPRRALGWALKLWWGWRAWRRLRPVVATLVAEVETRRIK